ncbi:MAG TPA: MFS transporter, partial [Casimicrobiaceae bacterium]|nr:MFS transporter [Casimicrobiaceae bacterium]
ASGLAMLVASTGAGALWDAAGAPATFATGAVLAAITALVLAATRRRLAPKAR